jgi:hypothetical protein
MRTHGSSSSGAFGSSVRRSPSLDQYSRWRPGSTAMPSASGGTTGGSVSGSRGPNGAPKGSSHGCVETNCTPSTPLPDNEIRAV